MDCSPPGPSVHGIPQARILERVVIYFSRGIFLPQGSNLGLLYWQAGLLPLSYQRSPQTYCYIQFKKSASSPPPHLLCLATSFLQCSAHHLIQDPFLCLQLCFFFCYTPHRVRPAVVPDSSHFLKLSEVLQGQDLSLIRICIPMLLCTLLHG